MNSLFDFLDHFTPLTLLKLMFLLGLSLYSFFAFLILRQIKIMNKAVSTPYGSTLWLFGLLHFLAALFVLFLAFIVL